MIGRRTSASRRLVVAAVFLLSPRVAHSGGFEPTPDRVAVFVQLSGLVAHVSSQGALGQAYPRRIDANGLLALLPGVVIGVDIGFGDRAFFRVSGALYKDCMSHTAGYLHLGLGGRWYDSARIALASEIGPSFLFRETWEGLPGYEQTMPWQTRQWLNRDWETILAWYGTGVDFIAHSDPGPSLQVTVVPAIPHLFNVFAGVRSEFGSPSKVTKRIGCTLTAPGPSAAGRDCR